MGALEVPPPRGDIVRMPVGLRISIGDKTTSRGGREIPTAIDWFRAKPGADNEHAATVERFHAEPPEGYGPEPRELSDLVFLSNEIGDVLDVRIMGWGSSGPRIVGLTNFATIDDRDEFERRCDAWDDRIVYFPLSAAEVPKRLKETWNGEPIYGELEGPDDPRIKRFELGIQTTLRFCAPRVIGLGTVVEVTSGGRKTRRNLYASIREIHHAFHGHLVGPKFRLSVRPFRTRRWVADERRYSPTTVQALVIETTMTVEEIIETVGRQREALGAGPVFEEMRALPPAVRNLPLPDDGEDTVTRGDPNAVERPDDATLNRIALLEQELREGGRDPDILRFGAFGVESAMELTAAQAVAYERSLERLAAAFAEDAGEGEIVGDDADDIQFGDES